MPDILYINGRWTTTDEKVIGVEDRGLQFGDSVYEVMKFVRRRPIFVAEHHARLSRGLELVEIPLPWSADELRSVCTELVGRTSFDEGLLYVQVTRGETPRNHFWPEPLTPTTIAYTRSHRFPDAAKKKRGATVITVPEMRWRGCNIKSTNLLPNAMAKKQAQRAGAEEALFVEEGEVREGASATFFAIREGRLITHPADSSILPGTVRDQVISIALAEKIRVDERPVRENELYALDEAFMTSTSLAVMPITSIDGRSVGNGRRGELTEHLQHLYDEIENQA
ncbi:MAG TPA: aminotransferase class IV [Thermoanaerobaculia bacterium]|nr:aminotransferase class IV [Thermoanaerobaculia bacterium]